MAEDEWPNPEVNVVSEKRDWYGMQGITTCFDERAEKIRWFDSLINQLRCYCPRRITSWNHAAIRIHQRRHDDARLKTSVYEVISSRSISKRSLVLECKFYAIIYDLLNST